jgi:hypothetical protein
MKGNERDAIVRKFFERGAISKHSAFTLRGKLVPLWRVLENESRELIRTRRSIANVLSHGSSGPATPPHLRCYTPDPSTWEARESVRFLEKHAEDIEAYRIRSIGMGTLTDGTGLQDNNSPQLVINNADSDSRDCESQGLLQTSQVSYTLEATTQSELSCGSLYP